MRVFACVHSFMLLPVAFGNPELIELLQSLAGLRIRRPTHEYYIQEEPGDDELEQPVVGGGPYNPVARMSRVTLQANVAAEAGMVDNLFVFYCVDWFPGCNALLGAFRDLAREAEASLNAGALLAPRARFGEVDCASEKALCNTMLVEEYATVAHYRGGVLVGQLALDMSGNPGKKLVTAAAERIDVLIQDAVTSSANSSSTEGPVDLPADHPVRIAAQMAPYVLASVAGMISTTIMCLDTLQAWRAASMPPDAFAGKSASEAKAQPTGVARFLPTEWASDRPSLEL